jgi:DNA repair exonuclease SbcCD ATPase subunit
MKKGLIVFLVFFSSQSYAQSNINSVINKDSLCEVLKIQLEACKESNKKLNERNLNDIDYLALLREKNTELKKAKENVESELSTAKTSLNNCNGKVTSLNQQLQDLSNLQQSLPQAKQNEQLTTNNLKKLKEELKKQIEALKNADFFAFPHHVKSINEYCQLMRIFNDEPENTYKVNQFERNAVPLRNAFNIVHFGFNNSSQIKEVKTDLDLISQSVREYPNLIKDFTDFTILLNKYEKRAGILNGYFDVYFTAMKTVNVDNKEIYLNDRYYEFSDYPYLIKLINQVKNGEINTNPLSGKGLPNQ